MSCAARSKLRGVRHSGHLDIVHKLTEVVAGKGLDVSTKDHRQTEYLRLCDAPTAFIAHIEAKTGMRKDMLASFGDI